MRRPRVTGFALLSLAVVLLGGLAWQSSAPQAVWALRALSDPAKLNALGERGANSRLNKIIYWLDQSNRGGLAPERAIWAAQSLNFTREPRAAMVKNSLLRNLRIAEQLGLLTAENRDRLRRGRAAVVTRGPYTGSTVEIDHIVPLSLAPEVGNELANLEMLPAPLNRSKSNRVGARQLAHAEALSRAGLIGPDSLARVRAKASAN